MNQHLEPVFEQVLPKITSANIPYWVYGGVGYASMVGHFYRSNPDVDLFVLGSDFENVENILENLCKENSWKNTQDIFKIWQTENRIIYKGEGKTIAHSSL